MSSRPILIASLVLASFAILGVGLVSATYEGTKARIAENERLSLLRKLQAIVPEDTVDNDMITDRIQVHDKELLGTAVTNVYRGRKGGEPVAAVLSPVVPDGYSGPIKLLVAVRNDGTLGGALLDDVEVAARNGRVGSGEKAALDQIAGAVLLHVDLELFQLAPDQFPPDRFARI